MSCPDIVAKFEESHASSRKRAVSKALGDESETEAMDEVKATKKKATKKSVGSPAVKNGAKEGFEPTPSKGGPNRRVTKVTGCQRKNGTYGYLVTWYVH